MNETKDETGDDTKGKMLGVKMPLELFEKLEAKCKTLYIAKSSAVRGLIAEWVKDGGQ